MKTYTLKSKLGDLVDEKIRENNNGVLVINTKEIEKAVDQLVETLILIRRGE